MIIMIISVPSVFTFWSILVSVAVHPGKPHTIHFCLASVWAQSKPCANFSVLLSVIDLTDKQKMNQNYFRLFGAGKKFGLSRFEERFFVLKRKSFSLRT